MPVRPRTSLILLSGVIAGTNACGSSLDCTQIEIPAIVATVLDARTGVAITDSATGFSRRGSFRAGLGFGERDATNRPINMIVYAPAGAYDVVIERPGYHQWSSFVIVPRGEGCAYLITETITARLAPIV